MTDLARLHLGKNASRLSAALFAQLMEALATLVFLGGSWRSAKAYSLLTADDSRSVGHPYLCAAMRRMLTLLIAIADASSNTTNRTSISGDGMSFPLRSGDAFVFVTSEAYANTNTTALRSAESQLRMLALAGVAATSGPESLGTQLLCMRVNPSIDDSTVSDTANATKSGDGGATGTGSSLSESSSSAAGARLSVTMGSVGLTGLLAAVVSLW